MNPLAQKVLDGNTRAIARAISMVENNLPEKEAIIDDLHAYGGKALVWGLTGPPGSGKSSLLNLILKLERERGKKIAVIAVDPSSPFSGGAILGDRLRMQKHATDDGIFIRSMASRGHLGGVAGATGDVIKVLDAAGFDLIIIETIGVGQTEIDIVEMADMIFLVLVPGLGDEIQALKAGVMEIGDLFVINKSDRDDAAKVKAEVEYVLHLKEYDPDAVSNPIVMTSVLENTGLDELLSKAEEYHNTISKNGYLKEKRKRRIAREIKIILSSKVHQRVSRELQLEEKIDHWAEAAYHKQIKPYAFINEKIKTLFPADINPKS